VYRTVGVTGAGYTFLALSTPIRLDSKESSTMSSEAGGNGQQSPLASQRAAEAGQAAQTGRFAKWFPLSASEGFSQWVSVQAF
jgi:cardiolipin-specific phospholipase